MSWWVGDICTAKQCETWLLSVDIQHSPIMAMWLKMSWTRVYTEYFSYKHRMFTFLESGRRFCFLCAYLSPVFERSLQLAGVWAEGSLCAILASEDVLVEECKLTLSWTTSPCFFSFAFFLLCFFICFHSLWTGQAKIVLFGAPDEFYLIYLQQLRQRAWHLHHPVQSANRWRDENKECLQPSQQTCQK